MKENSKNCRPNKINRPDEEALRRVLKKNNRFAAELVIRLAWQAGLTRPQIHDLTWDQVSFEDEEIQLSTHTVPIHPELLSSLSDRRNRPSSQKSEYVVLTDARKSHAHEVEISRFTNKALQEEEALKDISLKDLRDDFVIRILQEKGKAYAVRVGGIAMTTLYSRYGQFLPANEKNASHRISTIEDKERLLRLLSSEGNSPAGLTLWLVWKHGMSMGEVAALTWSQVDFEKGIITIGERKIEMTGIVYQLLKETYESRSSDADPHVLLTPRAKNPFDPDRLSVVTRTALMRGGLGKLHVATLPRTSASDKLNEKLLAFMQTRRFITRHDLVRELGLSWNRAYEVLRYAVDRNQITKIGTRYYLAGTVVKPEDHYSVIRDLIVEDGAATISEINKRLGTEHKAAWWIVNTFVEQGKLVRDGQKYVLPSAGSEDEASLK